MSIIHPIFTLMPTCEFLKLIPAERDLAYIRALYWEITKAGDNSPEEIEEHILGILGPRRTFQAECTKLKIVCVLTESVVISEQTPLNILVLNKERVVQCDDRKKCPGHDFKALETWVLDGLSHVLEDSQV